MLHSSVSFLIVFPGYAEVRLIQILWHLSQHRVFRFFHHCAHCKRILQFFHQSQLCDCLQSQDDAHNDQCILQRLWVCRSFQPGATRHEIHSLHTWHTTLTQVCLVPRHSVSFSEHDTSSICGIGLPG